MTWRLPDKYTVVLLHMDGADGFTTFLDESGRSWSITGNVQIDTAQSKFGGASCLFDGNGDRLSTADHPGFAFGSGNLTIDFRIRFNAFPASGQSFVLLNHFADASNQLLLQYVNVSGTKTWRFIVISGGSTIIQIDRADNSLSTGVWYHAALARAGNTWYWFRDGTMLGGAGDVDADSVPDFSGLLLVGDYGGGGACLNGWLDEVRISKGIARWTSNFVPPTRPYMPMMPVQVS